MDKADMSQPTSTGTGPSVLCLGAPRTGTKSLAEALRTLGYKKVYHTNDIPILSPDWKFLNDAADATFPNLTNHTPRTLTRADWDTIFGDYDAVTDIAAFYAPSLLAAYPDAKVILVERDLRSWWTSWVSYLDCWAGPTKLRMTMAIEKVIRTDNTRALYKAHLGWVGGARLWDLHDKARVVYDEHYTSVRKLVPAERMLEYQLTDGWGPLCGFLDKAVPEGVRFPRLNSTAACREFYRQRQKERRRVFMTRVLHPPQKKGKAQEVEAPAGAVVTEEQQTNGEASGVEGKKGGARSSVFVERFATVKKKMNEKRVSFMQDRKGDQTASVDEKKAETTETTGTAVATGESNMEGPKKDEAKKGEEGDTFQLAEEKPQTDVQGPSASGKGKEPVKE